MHIKVSKTSQEYAENEDQFKLRVCLGLRLGLGLLLRLNILRPSVRSIQQVIKEVIEVIEVSEVSEVREVSKVTILPYCLILPYFALFCPPFPPFSPSRHHLIYNLNHLSFTMFAQKVDEKNNFKVVVGKEISSKVDNFPLNGQGKGRFLFPA